MSARFLRRIGCFHSDVDLSVTTHLEPLVDGDKALLQLAAQRAAQRGAAAQPRPARDVSPRTLALAESMRRTLTLRRARQ